MEEGAAGRGEGGGWGFWIGWFAYQRDSLTVCRSWLALGGTGSARLQVPQHQNTGNKKGFTWSPFPLIAATPAHLRTKSQQSWKGPISVSLETLF